MTWDDTNMGIYTWDTNQVGGYFSWTLTVDETQGWAEVLRRSPNKRMPEILNVLDSKRGWTIAKVFASQPVAFAETFSRNVGWTPSFAESIGFLETPRKTVNKRLNDAFNVAELRRMTYVMNRNHAIAFAEAYARQLGWVRSFDHVVSVLDVGRHSVNKKLQEAFSTYDIFLRAGPLVLTDLIVSQTTISFEDFQDNVASGTPASYSHFVPFIPGDYSLTKADVRIVMTRDSTSQDLRLTIGKVFIDVPDVNDRGTATVSTSASVTPVEFNRKFVEAPEVTITGISAAAFAVPRVTNITKDGFDVELVKPDGGRTTGTVSWQSQGY